MKRVKLFFWICVMAQWMGVHCAYGWGELGHEIIGAIAEERMSADAKAFVIGILGFEPLSFSATWADAIRADSRFSRSFRGESQDAKDQDDHYFSSYHFIDLPKGLDYNHRPRSSVKDALGGILGSLEILRDPQQAQAVKVMALRFLVHLIGDIHQPLHVGNGHDYGGNTCLVYWNNNKLPTKLHAVWDYSLVAALGQTLKDPNDPTSMAAAYYEDYLSAFKKYRSKELNATKPSNLSAEDIRGWVNESQALRENVEIPGNPSTLPRAWGVYPEKPGDLSAYPNEEHKHRPYCLWVEDARSGKIGDTSVKDKKEISPQVIPRLDGSYIQANLPLVEHQLITAGLRLAAILDDLAATAVRTNPSSLIREDEQERLFAAIQRILQGRSR